MANNKTIFSIDGSKLTDLFSSLFTYLKETRFKINDKDHKNKINIPLYLAVILGILFPFITVATVLIVLLLSYNIVLEHESKAKPVLLEDK